MGLLGIKVSKKDLIGHLGGMGRRVRYGENPYILKRAPDFFFTIEFMQRVCSIRKA
jgi:hypothetical protein